MTLRGLCPPQKLLGDFKSGFQLGSNEVHVKHSGQSREKLWGIAQSVAELARPRGGSLNLRRAEALSGNERRPDRELQAQFPLDTLGAIRESLEQVYRSTEIGDCIGMRGALHRLP